MERICKKCGKPIEGYVAKVNTAETWGKELPPEEWCEDCVIAHGTCKCGGCGAEFTEDFRMPQISGDYYCVPCARDEVPHYFDGLSMFNDGTAARFFQAKIYDLGSGVLFHTSEPYSNPGAVANELRDSLDGIAEGIHNHCDPAIYLGDREYEEDEAYDEAKGQHDFNRATLAGWIELLIANAHFKNDLLEAFIVRKSVLNDYEPA